MLTERTTKDEDSPLPLNLEGLRPLPPSVRISALKSKLEELEIRLALLRRSKEHSEPASIIKRLVRLVATVVHLKNHLMMKKETLREQVEAISETIVQRRDSAFSLRQTETNRIAEFETKLKKIDLRLFILRLKGPRAGQRFEVKVAPDRSMLGMYLGDKELYHPA